MTKPTAFDTALDALRRYIVSHGLAPGDALPPVATLAATFGVSQATLREALRAWEAAGILQIRHGVGAFLQRYNWAPMLRNLSISALFEPDQGRQMRDLRHILESGLLARAVERLTNADVDALAALARAMSAGEGGRAAEFRFHALLAQAAGNPPVEELLRLAWLVEQQAEEGAPFDPAERAAVHHEIAQALRGRDAEAAREALERYFAMLARRGAVAA